MRRSFLVVPTSSALLLAASTFFCAACGDGGGSDLTAEQHFAQAQRLMDSDKPDEAMKHLQGVLDAEGASAELKTKAGFGAVNCQAQMGKGGGTDRYLSELEKSSPAKLDAKFYLGVAQTLLSKEQVEPAGKVIDAAKKRFPDDAALFEKISGDVQAAKADASQLAALGYLGGGSGNKDWVDLRSYWN